MIGRQPIERDGYGRSRLKTYDRSEDVRGALASGVREAEIVRGGGVIDESDG